MWLALACLLALAFALHVRSARARDELLPPADGQTDAHRARVAAALQQFDALYTNSFSRGQCTRDTVMKLYRLRDSALAELRDYQLRLPNDPQRIQAAEALHAKVARTLHVRIENAKRRAGTFLFRGAIDDMFETSGISWNA
jgi:hypothetical protein